MSSAHPIPDPQSQCTAWTTIPGSFIMMRNAPEWPWVYFPPPPVAAPEPRPTPLAPADLRAAMLHAETYLDGALDAQLDDELADVLRNLEIIAGIVQVAIEQLRTPSENRVLQ